MYLNIGCGTNKIGDCINIDVEPSVKPDLIADVLQGLPYENGTVDKIFFFHTMEHLQKCQHRSVLLEFARLLKVEGELYISYPEFRACVENWLSNHRGLRKFWEHTIFGRQQYLSDTHLALMDTVEVKELLFECGFEKIKSGPEPKESYNTIVYATKSAFRPLTQPEELAVVIA